jgi:lipoprotein-releasing system permease protein
MYKQILCWRYLKTRYLAFACIISVMLGVATLIVVNSVMNGFSTKLRDLLHNVMSDISIESNSADGFHNPSEKIARIRKDPYLNSQIESMTATLEGFAMVQFRNHNGEIATRPVRVLGIELKSRSEVGGFHTHLKSYSDAVGRGETPPAPSFDIPLNMQNNFLQAERHLAEAREREHVRAVNEALQPIRPDLQPLKEPLQPPVLPDLKKDRTGIPDDVLKFFPEKPAADIPPPMPVPHVARVPQGAIVGHLIANFNYRDPETGKVKQGQAIQPGESIVLTTVNSGESLKPVYDTFVVVDFFKSGMSEYDANCVFIPLDHLQTLRGMDNRASNILIKLKDYKEAKNVVEALAKLFAAERLGINTWEEKQGPLLKAIEIEKSILNILLFMIIAVAGFGILAIFSMIVSEKTRDIGILKALGASRTGILQIFLTYGLLLGVVGAGLGTILGLTITFNINAIELGIAAITGSRVFDGGVYYFNEIPTDVKPGAVVIVNLGAVAIATVFSILPALRAAMLHPVQALRYE